MGSGLSGNYRNTKGNLKPEHLMDELRNSGYKFNDKEVLMITKTRKSELVWLEIGNEKAGLKHILERHAEDIYKKFGIMADDIPSFIKDVFEKGIELSSNLKSVGYEKIYEYSGKQIVLAGVGTNGFIVTVYPGGK